MQQSKLTNSDQHGYFCLSPPGNKEIKMKCVCKEFCLCIAKAPHTHHPFFDPQTELHQHVTFNSAEIKCYTQTALACSFGALQDFTGLCLVKLLSVSL